MSIIITRKQIRKIVEWLGDDGDDDTEIKIRKGENHRKELGMLVSFPEYDQDGEVFFENSL